MFYHRILKCHVLVDLKLGAFKSTVEPVFATLLHHYGLRRLNPRGLISAHKMLLVIALAYNLKRLLRHRYRRTQGLVVTLPSPCQLRTSHGLKQLEAALECSAATTSVF